MQTHDRHDESYAMLVLVIIGIFVCAFGWFAYLASTGLIVR